MLLCHKETDNILIDKEKCNFFEKKIDAIIFCSDTGI